ncbi:MAG: hypothetical protein IPK19_01395 [Chloroflexi bacterium]|nr:hypothetical protein [Chloroflexota bacterium]
MAGNTTKMVYAEAEKMVEILHTGAEQLQETIDEMNKLADLLDNGALLGMAGDAFAAAIRSQLVSAVDRLADKMKEQSDYVQTEIYDMQEAERRAQQLFRD